MDIITFNETASRYEQAVNGHTVFANIRQEGAALVITHVEAPPALRGSGAAGKFMQALMEKLHDDGVKQVVPACGYAAAWLARHPEFAAMVKK